MSNGSNIAVLSRIGLGVSGLVVMAATALPVTAASAQELLVKFDGRELDLRKSSTAGATAGGAKKLQQITIGKGDRVEGSASKPAKVIEIGKGDRDEGTAKQASPRILIGKGDREEGSSDTKTTNIVIGKGDRNEIETEDSGIKRQVVVEPKPKKVVTANPVLVSAPAKKIIAANPAPKAKKVVVADAEPPVEDTPEAATETPDEEAEVTETPAPDAAEIAPAFKVGQIVTAGDGTSYVIVKVDASGISAMPLAAFTQHEQPKKVHKRKQYKKRYSTYRNYGGSSCH